MSGGSSTAARAASASSAGSQRQQLQRLSSSTAAAAAAATDIDNNVKMKALFKSKPKTPADLVRQTRDLLMYADRTSDTRETKREEKVDCCFIDLCHFLTVSV